MQQERQKRGMGRTTEYQIWVDMRRRCHDPRVQAFPYYGGRGITVCDRWRGSFYAFLADMGPRPSTDHTLDRIDNDGHYEPGNVRWATWAQQNGNTRQVHRIEFLGEVLPLAVWARRLGIPQGTLDSRIRKQGWSVERALTTPSPGQRRPSH